MSTVRGQIGDILKYWIPLAAAITVVCGVIYVAVQQDIRMAANDPQIQMASVFSLFQIQH